MVNLVSIIIPVYNVEKYLSACLDSVIAQDYENLEIILINDGSTDGSFVICQEYLSKDKRISLINKENGGLSSARNLGLDRMKGKWVMFVDSDDEIVPNMVSTMLNYALQNACDIVRCNCLTRGMNREEVRTLPVPAGLYERDKALELILKDILGSQACFGLYKSCLWKEIRFPIGQIFEDISTIFKVYAAGKAPVGILDTPLYLYNLHDDSTSFKVVPNKNYDRFLAFKEHSDYTASMNLAYEDYCFHNTAITAIGTYNYYIRFKDARLSTDKLKEILVFLDKNKKRVLHDRYNTGYHKLMFSIFYLSPHFYKVLMSFLYLFVK